MLTVKESDTHKVRWAFYETDDETGEPDLSKPIDLVGATVSIVIRPLKGKTVKEGFDGPPVEFTATVEDVNEVEWQLPGNLTPRRYALQIPTVKAGEKMTGPTSGSEILNVDPDLYDPEVTP